MSKLLHRGACLARNLLLDLRFGAFLGGAAKRSRFAHLGANESNNSDFDAIKAALKEPVIFDGRNLFDPGLMRSLGIVHLAVGRAAR